MYQHISDIRRWSSIHGQLSEHNTTSYSPGVLVLATYIWLSQENNTTIFPTSTRNVGARHIQLINNRFASTFIQPPVKKKENFIQFDVGWEGKLLWLRYFPAVSNIVTGCRSTIIISNIKTFLLWSLIGFMEFGSLRRNCTYSASLHLARQNCFPFILSDGLKGYLE